MPVLGNTATDIHANDRQMTDKFVNSSISRVLAMDRRHKGSNTPSLRNLQWQIHRGEIAPQAKQKQFLPPSFLRYTANLLIFIALPVFTKHGLHHFVLLSFKILIILIHWIPTTAIGFC